MKRYERYMDGVKVSDVLHEKLTNLKAPEKRPNPWLKWGALAAVVALVIGLGAWMEPGADPGYWLTDGETQSYYFLPALNFADASTMARQDNLLPLPGPFNRDADYADVTVLCGGEEAMKDHLLWDGLDWGGVLWFLEDGTPQAVTLYADGDGLHLSLEIMRGGKVPSCVVWPDEEQYTEWRGVEVTALKNTGYCILDGAELRESREVSFVADGVGYKLGLYTDDAKRAGELCARFVRYAVDGGFDLDATSRYGGAVEDTDRSVGEPNWNDGAAAPTALPDKGTPPPEMPTANIIHPGEEGYEEPLPGPEG